LGAPDSRQDRLRLFKLEWPSMADADRSIRPRSSLPPHSRLRGTGERCQWFYVYEAGQD
jgi:hypothetical protein